MAYVHWTADSRDTIVVLTRDRNPGLNSNSHVWISRDYGHTFENRTNLFMHGRRFAVIDMFYASPVNNTKYLFVDKHSKIIYRSTDDCLSFAYVYVTFIPDEISFHPSNSEVVLAYDETTEKLYYSSNFGIRWHLKHDRVRSFFWGTPPLDNANTLYIEVSEEVSGGRSNVVKTDYFSHVVSTLISGVNDFEVIDNYMFATKSSWVPDFVTLLVSQDRGAFQTVEIPTASQTKDFYIADVSENRVFLAVTHDRRTAHLYISDSSGTKYSLSMERVLYFSEKNSSPWLRRYKSNAFVDLHKVSGINGVYIASQLTLGPVGHRHVLTKITFNKGGLWKPVAAPEVDAYGNPLNCSLPTCSLQLSQKFGDYYSRHARFSPVQSWNSSPGIIMATGSYGTNLNAGVFLSSDAGLSWRMMLQGPLWWYSLGDHGGIFIAVPRDSLTNLIYYSWNGGKTWYIYKFLKSSNLYVHGLLTEPGEKSTEFTIYGSIPRMHKWIVVQINLRKVLGSPCKEEDYKEWIPSGELNGTCLLGRKSVYKRRITHAHCYNGYDYDQPITHQNCSCNREDFECDVGYFDLGNKECAVDTSSGFTPTGVPRFCPAGSTYRRSKGYRKVVGDTCQGGLENQFVSEMVPCPIAPQPLFLLYAAQSNIQRITLGANYTETTLPLGLQNAVALDFDYSKNCIYWADITLGAVKRSFLNGSGITETLHGGVQQVEGLALDWLGDNIYWVDAGAKKIEVSRTDGRFRKTLLTNNLDKPRAIALHPTRG